MSQRILIVGGPKVGKTTLADKLATELGITARHTDDLLGAQLWSKSSDVVASWIEDPGPWVIEGVTAMRALRKWVHAHHEGLPADELYLSTDAKVAITARQRAMTRGCMTVWSEIAVDLARRGLPIKSF